MEDLRFCRESIALCAALALLPLFAACNQGWVGDPRAVNKKTDDDTSSQYVSEIEYEEKTVADGEIDPFTHDTSLCRDCAEDWNRIDYGGFDGEEYFDNKWVLPSVNFDTENITQYAFGERSAGWTLSFLSTREYTYDASDEGNTSNSVIVGLPVNPMIVYQYRRKNPLFSPTSGYNLGERMDRFRFHRITGTAAIVPLDQFLIAVDTYSKFAFVYGYITGKTTVLGNVVPTEYEPVELHGEEGEDEGRPFYEYDPIGYVEDDGDVVLYERYKQDMIDASSVNYMPKVHSAEATMAQRNGAGSATDNIGRSPYYPGLYASGHGGS